MCVWLSVCACVRACSRVCVHHVCVFLSVSARSPSCSRALSLTHTHSLTDAHTHTQSSPRGGQHNAKPAGVLAGNKNKKKGGKGGGMAGKGSSGREGLGGETDTPLEDLVV